MCDLKQREDADFIASRIMAEKFYTLKEKEDLLHYLGPELKKDILETAKEFPEIVVTKRFINCVKIKFLRKAILKNSFGITHSKYDRIVSNYNFLLY